MHVKVLGLDVSHVLPVNAFMDGPGTRGATQVVPLVGLCRGLQQQGAQHRVQGTGWGYG